ncbi:hypothetical protein, partial [Staphylococcus aureus]
RVGSEMCIRLWFDVFFQAEDGIRDRSVSRGLGDVYKRQAVEGGPAKLATEITGSKDIGCLLYTSDAADDSLRVDLGGRRIIKKAKMLKEW